MTVLIAVLYLSQVRHHSPRYEKNGPSWGGLTRCAHEVEGSGRVRVAAEGVASAHACMIGLGTFDNSRAHQRQWGRFAEPAWTAEIPSQGCFDGKLAGVGGVVIVKCC